MVQSQQQSTAHRRLKIVDRGFVRQAVAGTPTATYTFPTLAVLSDGRALASFRHGLHKDSETETVELFESRDNGATWEQKPFFVPTVVNGVRGSAKGCHVTELEPGHLLAAIMWVDRATYPGHPLFNPKTEGCLPMDVILADSYDFGETWSPWRVVPMPAEIGPASITTSIMKLKDGSLGLSIETNKTYLDASKWYQRVVYFHSKDNGKTWGPPVNSGCDPTGRIFNWDQRAAVAPDGRIATFAWTYDTTENKYLNIHRRVSADNGYTWSPPDDVGFADQAGHPSFLKDGSIVLPYVDRFYSQSIKARWAADAAAPFTQESEVVIHQHQTNAAKSAHTGATTNTLVDMAAWCYGLPYSERLPNGEVLVLYYAGTNEAMNACWARIAVE